MHLSQSFTVWVFILQMSALCSDSVFIIFTNAPRLPSLWASVVAAICWSGCDRQSSFFMPVNRSQTFVSHAVFHCEPLLFLSSLIFVNDNICKLPVWRRDGPFAFAAQFPSLRINKEIACVCTYSWGCLTQRSPPYLGFTAGKMLFSNLCFQGAQLFQSSLISTHISPRCRSEQELRQSERLSVWLCFCWKSPQRAVVFLWPSLSAERLSVNHPVQTVTWNWLVQQMCRASGPPL